MTRPLTQTFVLMEVRRANELNKPIILVAESDAAICAPQRGRKPRPERVLRAGEAAHRRPRAAHGSALSGRIKVVPFKRSPAELEGMMRSLVSAMEPLWPSFGRALPGLSQNSKTLKVVGNPANSIGQCLRFMAEFERKGHAAVVDVSGALVAGAHALVGFLNAGVLEVPEVDAVLAALAVGLENRPSL